MEQWSEYSYECRKGIPDWLLDGLRRGTRTLESGGAKVVHGSGGIMLLRAE